jgi:hypothetical protein
VLFSFAVLLSRGCNLDMTLDEVSLILLGCICNSSAYILYPYAGGHQRTTNIEGLTCSWPRRSQSYGSCAPP